MHPTEDALNAFAEGSLTASESAEIERHVGTCVPCRELVDDVREILRATADLELRVPPARSWLRLERAIQLEQRGGPQQPQPAPDARPLPRRGRSAADAVQQPAADGATAAPRSYAGSLRWLAAAAALVLATVVGYRYVPWQRQAPTRGAQSAAESTAASGSEAAIAVESELRQAEAHYENAIKGLEQIANAEQNALDPGTAATLQKNLAVIDQAISESRAAVRSQPTSEPAQESLVENFKTKIALLQDTVALINEMRKGNEAGAARIVSGLKQKGN